MNAFATFLVTRLPGLSSPHAHWLAAVLAAVLLWLASAALIGAQAAEMSVRDGDGVPSAAPARPLTLALPVDPAPRGWRTRDIDTADDRPAGVEWKSRSSRLGFDRGVLGLQLDSGYRMSLRVKRGSFAVYMKGQF